MRDADFRGIAAALGGEVVSASVLAGGFSHETCLVDLGVRKVVARFGGGDPVVEAGVMAAARRVVPVPEVLLVLPGAMVIEYVPGTVLSRVLGDGGLGGGLGRDDAVALGFEVGRVIAGIAGVSFGRPGFFVSGGLAGRGPASGGLASGGPASEGSAGGGLVVLEEVPWSRQLGVVAEECMGRVPGGRLDARTRAAWVRMCVEHAPVLEAVDGHARLVHADVNPKNILVSRDGPGWRVDSVLDWEFSYSGCSYGDAANMARFGDDHPDGFLDGFRDGFAAGQPADLPLAGDWERVGWVLDMFALSDLVTRPVGHVTADQAAERIRHLVSRG
ncbi:MAG TPA: phosphotransferase [Actinoplanes sp.]|nr:phosphotransferase [Actinoplanes sp.]